jgi:hypothetical protein
MHQARRDFHDALTCNNLEAGISRFINRTLLYSIEGFYLQNPTKNVLSIRKIAQKIEFGAKNGKSVKPLPR